MRVKAITPERVQQYVDKRLEEGAAPATINRELDCLKRMMVIGSQMTPPKVAKVPHFPRLAEHNVREGFLEHDEFLAVRGAAADHLKVPITIAYYTGMRLREIISDKGIRWDQVELTTDFSGPVVSVIDGDTIEVQHNSRAERIRLIGIDCPAMRVNYSERPAVLLIPRGEGEAELCPNEKVVE